MRFMVDAVPIRTYRNHADKGVCMEGECKWRPREASGPITNASYSCDSQPIYVTFEDGSVDILTALTLRVHCRISSTAYLPSNQISRVYPLVVVAHPSKPNQFALGLTDGVVCLIEPLESEGKWGTSARPESVAGPSTMTVGDAGSARPSFDLPGSSNLGGDDTTITIETEPSNN
ncbi:topless-related protein 4 [Artemisia annua]|uniref:Topless-related protein 4 n=1 Tax=Artemisia annua TaxID=35608 RepID=A0A2U1NQ18_ARTAN|nr:topless-related protein 4 [Artemisia annua]